MHKGVAYIRKGQTASATRVNSSERGENTGVDQDSPAKLPQALHLNQQKTLQLQTCSKARRVWVKDQRAEVSMAHAGAPPEAKVS